MAEVIFNLKHTKNRIATIEKLSRSIGKVGQKALQLNSDQIRKNKDSDNRTFKPYSKDYVTQSASKRSGKKSTQQIKADQMNGKRNPINFVLKNEMMPAFSVGKITRSSVEVGFNSASARKKALWNYGIRKFVGLHKGSKKILFKFINKIVLKKA